MIADLLIPTAPPSKIRLGSAFDGGYAVCPDFLEEKLISIGCDNKTDFESAYLAFKPNSEITIYDPRKRCALANQEERVEFHKKEINSFSELDMSSECVVQMDIEGAEYKMINEYKGSFDNVSQLIIEYHFGIHGGVEKDWRPVLEKINSHFHLIHMHGNSTKPIRHCAPVPDVLECSYLHRNVFNPVKIEPSSFPVTGIDRPNRRGMKQHVLDWWID